MSQAADQVVVDTRQTVDTLRGIVDKFERFVIEDGAFIHFNRHDNHVGTTKTFFQVVVDLDVGVVLRQQIRKISKYTKFWQCRSEQDRHQHDQRKNDLRVAENPFLSLVKGVRNSAACLGNHGALVSRSYFFASMLTLRSNPPGPPITMAD